MAAEVTQRQHRVEHVRLDGHERDHQQRRTCQLGQDRGASPALVVAAQERQHQQEEAAGEDRLAGPVDRPCGWGRVTR